MRKFTLGLLAIFGFGFILTFVFTALFSVSDRYSGLVESDFSLDWVYESDLVSDELGSDTFDIDGNAFGYAERLAPLIRDIAGYGGSVPRGSSYLSKRFSIMSDVLCGMGYTMEPYKTCDFYYGCEVSDQVVLKTACACEFSDSVSSLSFVVLPTEFEFTEDSPLYGGLISVSSEDLWSLESNSDFVDFVWSAFSNASDGFALSDTPEQRGSSQRGAALWVEDLYELSSADALSLIHHAQAIGVAGIFFSDTESGDEQVFHAPMGLYDMMSEDAASLTLTIPVCCTSVAAEKSIWSTIGENVSVSGSRYTLFEFVGSSKHISDSGVPEGVLFYRGEIEHVLAMRVDCVTYDYYASAYPLAMLPGLVNALDDSVAILLYTGSEITPLWILLDHGYVSDPVYIDLSGFVPFSDLGSVEDIGYLFNDSTVHFKLNGADDSVFKSSRDRFGSIQISKVGFDLCASVIQAFCK